MRAAGLESSRLSLLGSLGGIGTNISFRKREIIYSVGDPSDSIFLIKVGSVKLTAVSADGNEALTAILESGDLFGPEALAINPPPRATSAVALTGVRVAKIDRNMMLDLLSSDQTICAQLISSLIGRITQLHEALASNLLYNSEQRLARVLLRMAEVAHHHNRQYSPALSQQELASMIGTTRQRVNFLLKRFKQMGFIEDARGKRVSHSLRNVAGAYLVAKR